MYLDFEVPIPDLPGKIGRFKKGNTVYIRYIVDRKYHADRKYNIPNHKIIGSKRKLPEVLWRHRPSGIKKGCFQKQLSAHRRVSGHPQDHGGIRASANAHEISRGKGLRTVSGSVCICNHL